MVISEKFTREISVGKYLDPFNGFQERESTFEVRRDEITGRTARILPYRFRGFQKHDVNEYLAKSPADKCPFCPPQVDLLTPKFTPDVIEAGKFQHGGALLFPNAFPHNRFNGIALFSAHHYLSLNELTPQIMQDGFLVCRDYFRRMLAMHPELTYCSVNWNYMPPAGAGLVHPHVQAVMGERPTRFMQVLLDNAIRYEKETGRHLWTDLIDAEKEAGERYVASTGNLEWIVSFAPKGMAGEIDFYLPGRQSIFEMTDGDLTEMLQGLTRVFAYFDAVNLISFNLTLFATTRENSRFPLHGRIVPRYLIMPLGTSDINYFEKLHDEIICPIIPEQICGDLQPYFKRGDH